MRSFATSLLIYKLCSPLLCCCVCCSFCLASKVVTYDVCISFHLIAFYVFNLALWQQQKNENESYNNNNSNKKTLLNDAKKQWVRRKGQLSLCFYNRLRSLPLSPWHLSHSLLHSHPMKYAPFVCRWFIEFNFILLRVPHTKWFLALRHFATHSYKESHTYTRHLALDRVND